MNCEEARAHIMDSLDPSGEPRLTPAIEQHVQQCPSCQDDLREFARVWLAIDQLGVPKLGREQATDMLDRLHEARAAGSTILSWPRILRGRIRRTALATAAVLIAAFVGAVISRTPVALRAFPLQSQSNTRDSTLLGRTEAGGGLYLFLLHRPDQLPELARGPRYQEWADTLESSNRLVRAGALSTFDGWIITGQPPRMRAERRPIAAGEIEGFFLIAARDSLDVIDAARISPHLGFGGAIEVRRVIN